MQYVFAPAKPTPMRSERRFPPAPCCHIPSQRPLVSRAAGRVDTPSKSRVISYNPIPRRFPPPWLVEEQAACFVVLDHNGQALKYVSYKKEPGRRSAAKLSLRDKTRRIAVNFAKLPELLPKALAANRDNAYKPYSTDVVRVEARTAYSAGISCRGHARSPCIVRTSQTRNSWRRLTPRKSHTTDNFRLRRDFQCRRY
jgi:hypothetical protein